MAGFNSRTKYEEETSIHFDEEVTQKVGIIDFTTIYDSKGRNAWNGNVPFSILIEMKKRGKVFLMDEANQMYTVRDIDEATRKVSFIANPIEPKDFAFYYGKEKMNKYHKQEMKERLEKSLQEKGMKLH